MEHNTDADVAEEIINSQDILLPHSDIPVTQKFSSVVQPIFGMHTTQIAPERDKRLNGSKECPFCYDRMIEETAGPKMFHELLIENTPNKVVSFPNRYSSGIADYVTVFSNHKTSPIEMSLADMDNFMESSYELAKELLKRDDINGMMEIINLGQKAGATQPHLHARRKGLTRSTIVDQDRESAIVNEIMARTGRNPIDEYLDDVIREYQTSGTGRYIFHNDYVAIFAPKAPRYTHEINIFLRKPRANILECEANPYVNERKIVGESMLGIFHALSSVGVTDLNVETHQDRFDTQGSAMRLHYKVIPKNINGVHAGFEDGGLYTVTKTPEETAIIGRRHYHTDMA